MASARRLSPHLLIGAAVWLVLALLISDASAESPDKMKWLDEGIYNEAPPSAYVGSAACGECHQRLFDHWKSTVMARFVRQRSDITGPLPGNWHASPIRDAEDRVMVVVGERKKVAFVTDDWRIQSYEYLLNKRKWRKRDSWAKGDTDYRSRCGVCHLTGLTRETREFVEPGVGCEACHGPGAKHAETENVADVVRVPGNGDAVDLNFCRSCHNERNNHDAPLADFQGPFHPPRPPLHD